MPSPHGHIKSFARREGHITLAQRRALEIYWDRYVIDPTIPLSPEAVFGRSAPLTLEIGFGNGESLAKMALNAPDKNFVGIEVHRPGVGYLMRLLHEQNITNVRIYCADAIEVIQQLVADQSLDTINLFFADPWPKKRHHKRRIVQQPFIDLVVEKLRKGGQFHAATDWEDYAQQMMAMLSNEQRLENCAGQNNFIARPELRPQTRFERRGLRLGHSIRDLLFRRV